MQSPFPQHPHAPFPMFGNDDYLILKGRDAGAFRQGYLRVVGADGELHQFDADDGGRRAPGRRPPQDADEGLKGFPEGRTAPRTLDAARKRRGVVPACLRNSVLRWLWQEQPTSSAMSQMLRSVLASRLIALRKRHRVTY